MSRKYNTFLLKNVFRIRNFSAMVSFMKKIDTTRVHSYIDHFFHLQHSQYKKNENKIYVQNNNDNKNSNTNMRNRKNNKQPN